MQELFFVPLLHYLIQSDLVPVCRVKCMHGSIVIAMCAALVLIILEDVVPVSSVTFFAYTLYVVMVVEPERFFVVGSDVDVVGAQLFVFRYKFVPVYSNGIGQVVTLYTRHRV